MDYRDANTIEQDRRAHYRRTFGGRAPTAPIKHAAPWAPIDIDSLDGAENWTPEEKEFLDNLYNG